jgi:3-oxo-5alpha-steroid 4-dehydrogenase
VRLRGLAGRDVQVPDGILRARPGRGEDPPLLRHSVAHYHWLVAHGVPFKPTFYGEGSYTPTDDCLSYSGSELAWPYPRMARPAPRGHTVQQPSIEAGGRADARLLAAVERTPARVERTRSCETLVVDDGRAVVGVVAQATDASG